MSQPPAIPEFTYRDDWFPAIRAATRTLSGKRRQEFHKNAQDAQDKMIPMLSVAFSSYVAANYQKQSLPVLSSLLPELRGIANGNRIKINQRLDPAVQREIDRAANNSESTDVRDHARMAIRNVEVRIAAKEQREARHKGDRDLDRLIGSFSSSWADGFDGDLPSYTPGIGPFPAFIESAVTTYARRLPDEYANARSSLLAMVDKQTAVHKRYKKTGFPKLKALIRKWADKGPDNK